MGRCGEAGGGQPEKPSGGGNAVRPDCGGQSVLPFERGPARARKLHSADTLFARGQPTPCGNHHRPRQIDVRARVQSQFLYQTHAESHPVAHAAERNQRQSRQPALCTRTPRVQNRFHIRYVGYFVAIRAELACGKQTRVHQIRQRPPVAARTARRTGHAGRQRMAA